MDNFYYIATSEGNRTVFSSDNYHKIADFIKENQDARFRTVNYTGKPKILPKTSFLVRFLTATKDKHTFFRLARVMITDASNLASFLCLHDLNEEYKEFRREFL